MLRKALLALWVCAPSSALAQSQVALSSAAALPASSRQVDVVSMGGYRFTFSMPLVAPFEKLLRSSSTHAQILSADNAPTFFKGNTYRYRLPDSHVGPLSEGPSTSTVRLPVLESEYGFFLLSPPDDALMRDFEAAVKRPDSYPRPMQPEASLRWGELSAAQGPEGTIYSLKIDSPRPVTAQWRKSVVLAYRLWLRGRMVDAVFIYKTQGGLNRLASALEAVRREGRPGILVSRGSLLARDTGLNLEGRARLEALEGLGLQVSGVGLGEFRMWDDLEAYRRKSPSPIHFISANLVLSSAPASAVLPPAEIVEAGGLRVGFIGLTRPSYKKYMTAGKLKGMAIADPLQAAQTQVELLRPRADVVIVLSNLEREENARLQDELRGIDLIVGDDEATLPETQSPRTLEVMDSQRRPYDPCLLLASEFSTAVNQLTIETGLKDSSARWLRLRQKHLVLDEAIPDQSGFPEFDNEAYGVSADTRPALIPAARRLFPENAPAASGALPTLSSRDFWSMAASLMVARSKSEAAVLPALGISVRTKGDITEGMVRDWFYWDDNLVTVELSGKDLTDLIAEVRAQQDRERRDLPLPAGKLRITVGGLGAKDTIHGVPIDPTLTYRVAVTDLLLGNAETYPALSRAKNSMHLGDLREAIIAELRAGADGNWPIERYRSLVSGAPLAETSFWKVNFRDISLNATNTTVVRDDAFSSVPNSRIQGFNQQLIGMTAKIDLDYLYREYKWSNSFIMDYSRVRLHPPGQPTVLNLPTNQLSFLTSGTKRVGSFPIAWLAQAYGPSLGFQYEGEVERNIGGPHRKHIFYLYPGVQFFSGTVIQSVDLSANLKRDISRDPPNNQYGLRARAVGSTPIKKGLMTLQGETWANYFVLTHTDSIQDLRLEGDINAKLQIPIFHRFTLAPFIDFYYFQLKVQRPVGYSVITGVSLGFSRLWKPQYEKF